MVAGGCPGRNRKGEESMAVNQLARYRSATYTFQANGNLVVPRDFLDDARKFAAPVIRKIRYHFKGTGNASSARAADLYAALITRLRIADEAGDRLNVTGQSLRIIENLEQGPTFSSACLLNGTLQTSITGTGVTIDKWFTIDFEPKPSRRRHDFGLPLGEFIDAGYLQLTQGGGSYAGWSALAGTWEIFVDVLDEGRREGKSRLCWFDYQMVNNDYNYTVNGALRAALAYVGSTEEAAGTPWQLTTTWDSKSLSFINYPSYLFQDSLRLEGLSSVLDPADEFSSGYTIPLFVPAQDQAITEMPEFKTFHAKLNNDTVKTDSLMIVGSITDRSETLTEKTLGVSASVINAAARANLADGQKAPVSVMPSATAARLPVVAPPKPRATR